MDYEQTLEFLYSQLPMYQREGKTAYKADLSNTQALCKLLHNPERQLKCIHVGGTNGKGSVSHMLASVLQAAGYRVGLYTSPHLKDFRERIRINGIPISRDTVVAFVENNRSRFQHLSPSFFEYTVAMAFDYFALQKVDFAIIEVGMGGRLDSTNVIHPLLSVITNVGWDHMAFLGDTLEKIAGEKAGIIKRGVPVIIGKRQPETETVFIERAEALQAPLTFADQVNPVPYSTDLMGTYQKENLQTVGTVIQQLKQHLILELPELAIENGLMQVAEQTGLMGRWQVLQTKPFIVADVAHNVDGLRQTLAQFMALPFKRYFIVLGSVNDKDLSRLMPLFPSFAYYYLCAPSVPRALPVEELTSTFQSSGFNCKSFETVKAAVNAARSELGAQDGLYIGGSTFVVAEAIP